MPYLSQIHKVGHLQPPKEKDGEYSNMDIEDLDAGYQSFFNQPLTQRKTESDVSTRETGVGSGEMGDIPIEDSSDQEQKKIGKLITKHAYKLQGHMTFQGLPIAIENKAGSVRRGVDKDGTKWETRMKYPYGYIQGTEGADGEGVDVYVGPDEDADTAYVVHQKDPETGKYDEDKILLGFRSKKEAKEAFEAHYDDPEDFLGPIKAVSMERLKELAEAKGRLVKIARASYVAMLQELYKLAADEVGGLPQEPSAIKTLATDLRSTNKTINLAKKLWQARDAIPMLI